MRRYPRTPWESDSEMYAEPEAPSAVSHQQQLALLLKRLKDGFPPRCMEAHESVEQHMRYAGKVELAQALLREFGKDD